MMIDMWQVNNRIYWSDPWVMVCNVLLLGDFLLCCLWVRIGEGEVAFWCVLWGGNVLSDFYFNIRKRLMRRVEFWILRCFNFLKIWCDFYWDCGIFTIRGSITVFEVWRGDFGRSCGENGVLGLEWCERVECEVEDTLGWVVNGEMDDKICSIFDLKVWFWT